MGITVVCGIFFWLVCSWTHIVSSSGNSSSASNGSRGQKIVDDLLSSYDGRVSPTDALEDGPVEDTVQLYILSLDSSDDSTVTSHTTATLPPICE